MSRRPRLLHVVQARMGSQRLPGKVMSPICGWPLLQYTVSRALAAGLGDVLVATTMRPEDDPVALMAGQLGVAVVRGPDLDVLGRFALVARTYPEAQWLARWTADNPFPDIGTTGRLLATMPASADYAVEEGLPVGAAVELVSRTAILDADREATAADDREHVTLWMKRFDAGRRHGLRAADAVRAPDVRLTVDTLADLQAIRQLAADIAGRGWDPRLAPLADVIAAARVMTKEGVA